jgi:hypothetical protein
MPLSAKHAAQSPIKIFVSMADPTSTRVKKSGPTKDHNKSNDKDLSAFLVKKPSAGLVNLKLGRNVTETRGYSFDQDVKNTASLPLGMVKARRNSSKGSEKLEKTDKSKDKSLSQKAQPYFSQELMSFGKRKNDSGSAVKSKLKVSGGFINFNETKESQRKGLSASKPKLLSSEPIGITLKNHPKISIQGGSFSPKKTDLSSMVTQLSEEEMNKLGGIYAEEPKELTEEEILAEQFLIPKKLHRRDYLQAKLPYYTGGVLVFFHEAKKDYFATLYKEHFRHTFASLKFCKGLVPATTAELAPKQKHYAQKSSNKHSKCLVLDLDETLIHCVTAVGQPADIYLPIKFPNGDTVKVSPSNLGSNQRAAVCGEVPGADVQTLRGVRVHGFEQLLRRRGFGLPGPRPPADLAQTVPGELRADSQRHVRQRPTSHWRPRDRKPGLGRQRFLLLRPPARSGHSYCTFLRLPPRYRAAGLGKVPGKACSGEDHG